MMRKAECVSDELGCRATDISMQSVEFLPGVKDNDPVSLDLSSTVGEQSVDCGTHLKKTCFQIKVSHVCLIVCLLQISYLVSLAPANAEFGR